MMQMLRVGNLVLAFALELAMLAAYFVTGWWSTDIMWLRFVLAIGLPALAIVLWAVWAAPKARKTRLHGAPLVTFKLLIFGVAVAGLCAVGWWIPGVTLAVLVVANLAAAAMFGQI